jgi:hypothetical protein
MFDHFRGKTLRCGKAVDKPSANADPMAFEHDKIPLSGSKKVAGREREFNVQLEATSDGEASEESSSSDLDSEVKDAYNDFEVDNLELEDLEMSQLDGPSDSRRRVRRAPIQRKRTRNASPQVAKRARKSKSGAALAHSSSAPGKPPTRQTSKRILKTSSGAKVTKVTTTGQQVKPRKFEISTDVYCIPPKQWEAIGKQMQKSSRGWPSAFRDAIKSIFDSCHSFKSAEWKRWCHSLAPIYLLNRIPEKHYVALRRLTEAMALATMSEIALEDIPKIRRAIIDFIKHYEEEYYQYSYRRICVWKPVFHQLLHVIQFLIWVGPMIHYWQWFAERYFGFLVDMVSMPFTSICVVLLILYRFIQGQIPIEMCRCKGSCLKCETISGTPCAGHQSSPWKMMNMAWMTVCQTKRKMWMTSSGHSA